MIYANLPAGASHADQAPGHAKVGADFACRRGLTGRFAWFFCLVPCSQLLLYCLF
jgi:hypothetical protein